MAWEIEEPQATWVVEQESAPLPKAKSRSVTDIAKDAGKGALSGAADLGNTLINAATFIPRKLVPELDQWNTEREASLDDFNKDNDSTAFNVGRIGANIAGTAGVGGILGKGIAAIPSIAKYAPAISSGGFNLGPAATGSTLANAGLRTAAGAIQGGAQTALVAPEATGTGAVVGALTPGAVKVVGKVGSLAKGAVTGTAKNFLGATTGAGADAVSGAYQAGKRGATEFLDNMRGDVPFDDVVASAKEGLTQMRLQRQQAYRSGMAEISKDKSVLDFAPIDDAMKKISGMGSFKGVQINKNAAGIVDDLAKTIDDWKALNPADYHTPEGLDALKQAVGDIRDTTQFGTASRKAADSVYNAVKNQISMQAPTYSKVMKDYSEASKALSEIESALSLGNKAKADTSIRKLQSLMRNNAQTSYGNRLNLASQLEQQGGVDLMPSIAGQAMTSWTPRGMTGAIEKVGAAGLPALAWFNPAAAVAGAAVAPLTSPRIVGEAAYKLGRGVGATGAGAQYLADIALPGGARGLLDPSVFARTLPVAISANQAVQR